MVLKIILPIYVSPLISGWISIQHINLIPNLTQPLIQQDSKYRVIRLYNAVAINPILLFAKKFSIGLRKSLEPDFETFVVVDGTTKYNIMCKNHVKDPIKEKINPIKQT